MTETLLKTRQIAEALGVSVSTIKRWVDDEEIPATRTVGGHRLIPLSGAIRFARERNLPVESLERWRGAARPGVTPRGQPVSWKELANALKRGRATESRALILDAYASGVGAPAMADDLIRPVMEQIGHDWERQSLDVYQEHRASRIVETVIQELIRRHAPPMPDAPLAIGASPSGDLYTVPGLLCELTLRELGWEVVNLGPNLPLTSMARAICVQRPLLAWLSLTNHRDTTRFLQEYKAFYDAVTRTGTAVILGGSALTPALRTQLVAASFGDRMAHLCEFAKRLHPASAAAPSPRNSGLKERPGAIPS